VLKRRPLGHLAIFASAPKNITTILPPPCPFCQLQIYKNRLTPGAGVLPEAFHHARTLLVLPSKGVDVQVLVQVVFDLVYDVHICLVAGIDTLLAVENVGDICRCLGCFLITNGVR
jgi:hypothetical protein